MSNTNVPTNLSVTDIDKATGSIAWTLPVKGGYKTEVHTADTPDGSYTLKATVDQYRSAFRLNSSKAVYVKLKSVRVADDEKSALSASLLVNINPSTDANQKDVVALGGNRIVQEVGGALTPSEAATAIELHKVARTDHFRKLTSLVYNIAAGADYVGWKIQILVKLLGETTGAKAFELDPPVKGSDQTLTFSSALQVPKDAELVVQMVRASGTGAIQMKELNFSEFSFDQFVD
jgi:hypothetical protein